MKRLTTYLSLLSFLLISSTKAQNCTTCTLTISIPSTLPLVVNSGTLVCITSTGSVNAPITVLGGQICNEGTINSTSILINGGNVFNHGTFIADDVAITDGDLENYGSVNITDLGITGVDITLDNQGSFTVDAMAMAKVGNGSPPTLLNTGTMTIDSIGMTESLMQNDGNLNVTTDFVHAANSNSSNLGYMQVGRHFVNTLADFHTECMIPVGGNWVNDGNVTGPISGCGGFTVSDTSVNNGNFAVAGSNLDLCDLSGGAFDVNTGTFGANATHCGCNNTCTTITGINEIEEGSVIQVKLYPNPVSENATLQFNEDLNEFCFVEIFDVQGKLIRAFNKYVAQEFSFSKNQLQKGLYLIRITTASNRFTTTRFTVE